MLALPPPAPFAELPFRPVAGAAACLRATGAPGEVVRWTPAGVELLSASRVGLAPTGEVALGAQLGCPAVASQANGAGVLAGSVAAGVRVSLRPPGGGWAAPVTVPAQHPQRLAAAVSARGDAVVAWVEYDAERRVQLRVARRAPGGPVGTPVDVLGWARRVFPPEPVVGVAADGETLVAWTDSDADPLSQNTRVATARPGAAFAASQRLGDSFGLSAPALAVAADGRALVAFGGHGGERVAERAPGAAFGASRLLNEATGDAAVALRDDGAAVVAWGDQSSELLAVTRAAPGAFGPVQDGGPSPESGLGSSSGVLTLSASEAGEPPVEEAPSPQVLVGAGGQGVIVGRTRAGLRLATVSTTGVTGFQAFASPLRDADAVTPLLTVDGSRALAWQDDRGGLSGAPYAGRLHLAVEGGPVRLAAPAPAIRVTRPPQRALRIDQGLTLPVRCAAACDLRVSVRGRGDIDAQASLTQAGSVRLRLVPEFGPLAPVRRGTVRVDVLAGAPGAASAKRTTLKLTLRRIPPPPLPRILAVRAVRRGGTVDVRWTTDVAARLADFFVMSSTRKHSTALAFAGAHGGGRRSFHVVVRAGARARWVLVSVTQRVTDRERHVYARVAQ